MYLDSLHNFASVQHPVKKARSERTADFQLGNKKKKIHYSFRNYNNYYIVIFTISSFLAVYGLFYDRLWS